MLRIMVERAGNILQDEVFSSDVVSIGRDPDRDVVLESPVVSGLHLVIKADPSSRGYRYIDQSANGTFVSGERVATGMFDAPVILRVGEFEVTLIPVTRSGTAEHPLPELHKRSRESTLPGRALDEARSLGEGTAELRLVSGVCRPDALTFNERVVVGRSSHCDVTCSRPEVSRQHFEILHSGRDYTIHRISSRNNVEVNGSKLAQDEKRPLSSGDLIAFCGEEILFFTPARAPRGPRTPSAAGTAEQADLAVYERVCAQRDIVALDVVGFLGEMTEAKLRSAIGSRLQNQARILLDLGYLAGIDQSGIQALVGLIREADLSGAKVQLIRVPPRVIDSFIVSPQASIIQQHMSGNEMSGVRRLNNAEEQA